MNFPGAKQGDGGMNSRGFEPPPVDLTHTPAKLVHFELRSSVKKRIQCFTMPDSIAKHSF